RAWDTRARRRRLGRALDRGAPLLRNRHRVCDPPERRGDEAQAGARRGAGVLLPSAFFFGLIALGLWLVIPAAIDQVQAALGPSNGLREEAQRATGVKQDILAARDRRLRDLPSGGELVDPAVEYGR